MTNTLIIAAAVLIFGVVIYRLTKKGKIADKNNNFVPDVVEDAASKVVEEVVEVKRQAKQKARQVKSTANSVAKKVKNTANKGSRKSNTRKPKN
jgi:hypothetical protein